MDGIVGNAVVVRRRQGRPARSVTAVESMTPHRPVSSTGRYNINSLQRLSTGEAAVRAYSFCVDLLFSLLLQNGGMETLASYTLYFYNEARMDCGGRAGMF